MFYFEISAENPQQVNEFFTAAWNAYSPPNQKNLRCSVRDYWRGRLTGLRQARVMQGGRRRDGTSKIVKYSYVSLTHENGTTFDCIIPFELALQIAGVPPDTTDLTEIRNALLTQLRLLVLRPIENPLIIKVRAYSKFTDTNTVKYSMISLE